MSGGDDGGMVRRRRPLLRLLAATALASLLALGACGTSEPVTVASPASAPASEPGSAPPSTPGGSASGTPTEPAAAFCAEIRAQGANGASFGPIPTFYRKKPLLSDVRDKLEAMGTVAPPSEVAKPWALQKRTLLRVEKAAGRLSSDQTLADLPDVDLRSFHGGAIDKAQDTLTDYYFAHCR